ncbi:MAG: sigma-54-dependent Fis family transcriptional regulator [Acidobacteria bacterium]|nr:sigma-54-dependent Fis family transcriptional regulator [Acidobacteriota bacterium]
MNRSEYRLLVVDDDAGMRLGMVETLKRAGYTVDQAADALEGFDRVEKETYQVVVTDMRMPRVSGLDFLKQVKGHSPATEVLVVTAYGTIQNAVDAIKYGAYDYILKPFSPKDLTEAIQNALTKQAPRMAHGTHGLDSEFVSRAPAVVEMLALAKRAAASQATILVQAESGTGKELLARFIIANSPRAQKPTVAVNCAALPDNLLESELFGYEKGAFTGALHAKPGKFEMADGGTLLLDEIGEMPLALQPKLLRAIQEGEIDRIGGKQPRKVDARIIALTNQNLQGRIKEGHFREDLYFRLNVIPLEIPPLRARLEDIEPLCAHFIRKFGGGTRRISEEAFRILKRYQWPGNVRELENMVHRALVLSPNPVLEARDLFLSLPQEMRAHAGDEGGVQLKAGQTVHEMERRLIELTLEETDGNRTHAAEMLGISLRTLRNKLNEYKSSNN